MTRIPQDLASRRLADLTVREWAVLARVIPQLAGGELDITSTAIIDEALCAVDSQLALIQQRLELAPQDRSPAALEDRLAIEQEISREPFEPRERLVDWEDGPQLEWSRHGDLAPGAALRTVEDGPIFVREESQDP